MDKNTIGIIEIIVATLIWGSLGVMVRNIDMEPFSIVAYRSLIALPIMLVLFRKKKDSLKKNYKLLLLASIAITMAWSAHLRIQTNNNCQYSCIVIHWTNLCRNIITFSFKRSKREKSQYLFNFINIWNFSNV